MIRNPDVDLETETIPPDCYLHRGKMLQATARAAAIPFGLGYTKVLGTNHSQTTHGLIIRLADQERMLAAIERKTARQLRDLAKKTKLATPTST